jgi:hypothetical protein
MCMKPMLISLVLLTFLSSCVSYDQLRENIGIRLETSDLEGATKLIEKKKWYKKDRNKVLYYLELGALARMQGKLQESNEYLNKADFLIEDYRASVGAKGLAVASNARVLPYRTEYYENIAVHYLKSLNFLQLNQLEAARVEARRTNIKLQQLNDAVPNKPFKYHDDVLGHIVMGLSYEKNGEWNNAFIAYRNAAELFIEDDEVVQYMGVRMPEQLKCDLVNMANKIGFANEVSRYRRILKPRCKDHESIGTGQAVIFWENGRGPRKEEEILGFDVLKYDGGSQLRFVNYSNNIEYNVPAHNYNEYNGFAEVNNIRLALPTYRPQFYPLRKARLQYPGGSAELELIEDLNQVAQQSLQDRFHRELANALLRLAVKEATEASLRTIKTKKKNDSDEEDEKSKDKDKDEDEYSETAGIILSSAVGIVNAITERADVRSWNTLPAEISYTRIPLKAGMNDVKISFYNRQNSRATEYKLRLQGNGRIQVRSIITPDDNVLDTLQPIQN